MGGRTACLAVAVLAVCAALASAGVFVFPASAVVGGEGSRRREALYDADDPQATADLALGAHGRTEKRASNLGSRLMCQLDSRNCGTFNMGKKFGRFSWLRSADSTWRRLQYELGGHRWERGVEAGGGEWQDDDDDGRPLSTREERRNLQESEPNDELQILRVD